MKDRKSKKGRKLEAVGEQRHVYISVHWKQGDDLAQHLAQTSGNVPKALRDWADKLSQGAEGVRQVAAILEKGTPVEISANLHHIGFAVDESTKETLIKTGVVFLDIETEETIEEIEEVEKDFD